MILRFIKDLTHEYSPTALYLAVATPYFYFHPSRDATLIVPNNGLWKATNLRQDRTLYYPISRQGGRVAKYGIEKDRLYQLPGGLEVTPGDTVIDVGAYVGEFSTAVAPTAGRVVAIEPDPESVCCLKRNTESYANVTVEQALLDVESGERTFQLGTNPTENSMFGLDAGRERESVRMPTETLPAICARHGIDTIDFLKLEAEGSEPEILDGASEITIRKIAVGVGPERNGEYTRDSVKTLLDERGYEVLDEANNVLFATRQDE